MSTMKLTEGQKRALLWFTLPRPTSEPFLTWAKYSALSPDKRSLISCVKLGLVERVGLSSWERYALTDLGRSALSETIGEGK